jgi:hypothetical protein
VTDAVVLVTITTQLGPVPLAGGKYTDHASWPSSHQSNVSLLQNLEGLLLTRVCRHWCRLPADGAAGAPVDGHDFVGELDDLRRAALAFIHSVIRYIRVGLVWERLEPATFVRAERIDRLLLQSATFKLVASSRGAA